MPTCLHDIALTRHVFMTLGAPYLTSPVDSSFVYRIIRKVPELVEVFASPAGELLNDRNHAVVLCGVSLMLQVNTMNTKAACCSTPFR